MQLGYIGNLLQPEVATETKNIEQSVAHCPGFLFCAGKGKREIVTQHPLVQLGYIGNLLRRGVAGGRKQQKTLWEGHTLTVYAKTSGEKEKVKRPAPRNLEADSGRRT